MATMLEGLTFARRHAAEMACIEGALRYLGRDVSAAWLYGGTGHAFAMNMRPTACVSSPYAWRKTVYDLAPNLGFRLMGFSVSQKEAGETFAARQREAWDLVRDALDRGLPCYADRVCWVPDYALITGYDDVGYYYLHAACTGGPTPWEKLGTEDIKVLDVWRVELCEPRPDEEVVRAALAVVLERAATPHGWTHFDGQVSGPAGFDLWADEVAAGRAILDSHGWNAHFWHEYRAMAVDFLAEAKVRLAGRCDATLDAAIAHYMVVRDRLATVRDQAPFRNDANWTDLLRSAEVAGLIREAGAAEREGLAALGEVLAALGGPPDEAASAWRAPAIVPKRFVLDGVRRLAMDHAPGNWRFTPFCNAFSACLEYLGQEDRYDCLMAVSGAAFRMMWQPRGWDEGNSDILGMAVDTLAPMRRAFRASGHAMQVVAKADPGAWPEDILHDAARRESGALTDEAGFRRHIVASINAGKPVIAFGVIGPPEACVITGYDEAGDVLIGWNTFQRDEKAETEPSGCFRKRDWYGNTHGLLLLGECVERPSADVLARDALAWMIEVLRTREVRDHAAGPAAFDAWAADILEDDYFPAGDEHLLRARMHCHWDGMIMQAERATAVPFLRDTAEREPAMAEPLREAIAILTSGGVKHGVAPGEEAHVARLADPTVRREMAESILATRDDYLSVAELLEQALLASGPHGI